MARNHWMLMVRILAAGLVLLVGLPWYRLLQGRARGPAAEQVLSLAPQYSLSLWTGSVLTVVGAVVLGRFVTPEALGGSWIRLRGWLADRDAGRFGAAVGGISAFSCVALSRFVLQYQPPLLDGTAQLIQARYFASGSLAGPVLEHPEFWQFQFMVASPAGWVSQYPPGFAGLLALGVLMSVPWVVGPLCFGLTLWLLSIAGDRLFQGQPEVARLGTVFCALSPFLLFHASAFMSHVLAALLWTLGILAVLRILDGHFRWYVVLGLVLGASALTRPFTALVLAGMVGTMMVILRDGNPEAGRWPVRAGGLCFLGASPFLAYLLLYNARIFGHPLRFGYSVSEGPGHGLGFHIDPWGDFYGPLEALAYTSSDLLSLNTEVHQWFFPLVLLVCIHMLLVREIRPGWLIALLWAMLPVVAHSLYWHHDLYMGPRLLYESAIGWSLLAASALVALLNGLEPKDGPVRVHRMRLRAGLAVTFVVSAVVAVIFSGPTRLTEYRDHVLAIDSGFLGLSSSEETIVFVHDSWESRLGARLSASGMRVDSIRMALRHNTSCEVESFLQHTEHAFPTSLPQASGTTEQPRLRFKKAGNLRLEEAQMPSGSVIRTYPGEILTPPCEVQGASDFEGVLALPPLLVRGRLPGIAGSGPMFVRDLGPAHNRRLLEMFPSQEPRVLMLRGADVRLVPYARGMALLWGDTGSATSGVEGP